MQKFETPQAISNILGTYPGAEEIFQAAKHGGRNSKMAIARLWLSEGIPYAFKESPAIYESVRDWLASRLLIHPKEISLTGSARLGQSLSPDQLGQEFSSKSDLDLFVVSSDLFSRMVKDFNQFSFDFESKVIVPKNRHQQKFWPANIRENPARIGRGFIDSWSVPNMSEYPTIKEIGNTMWLLKEKLDATENAPKIKEATIRCYRSWSECVNQIAISL